MEARRLWIPLILVLAILCVIGFMAYALYLKLVDVPFAATSIVVALVSGLALQAFALVTSRAAWSGQARAALNDHYNRLNQNIFVRLQRPQFVPRVSTSNTPFYRMEFSWDVTDIQSSPFWSDAEKHIRKDIPEFFENFERMEKRAREYNQEFDAFRTSEQHSITNKLEEIGNVSDILTEETILRSNVISLIEETMLGFQLMSSTQVTEQLKHIWRSQLKIGRRDKDCYFGSYTVCRFATDENVDRLRNVIDGFIHDASILNKLNGFWGLKSNLEKEAQGFMAAISRIVFLIEDDRYTTEVECCKQIRKAHMR